MFIISHVVCRGLDPKQWYRVRLSTPMYGIRSRWRENIETSGPLKGSI